MSLNRRSALVGTSLLALVVTGCSQGDDATDQDAAGGEGCDYPTRGITLIVPYSPGGSTDPMARTFAQLLEDELDVAVSVENRPGGSGMIGTGDVVTAEPDGYTIGLTTNANVIPGPLTNPNLPWDDAEDYTILTHTGDNVPNLAVRSDSPWETMEELLDAAREDPGEIRVSTSGEQGTAHLSVEILNEAADVELSPVAFSGGAGEAVTALLGGDVEANSSYPASLRGQVEAGDLRVLGTFGEQTFDFFPGSVALAEQFPDVDFLSSTYFMMAPAGLPDCVRDVLLDASSEVVHTDEYLEFAETNGYQLDPDDVGPDYVTGVLEREQDIWAEVLE